MSSECIFCKIVSGEAPSITVYEDAATMAFMDIFPWAKGHCLVIPREHSATIFEISEGSAAAVMSTVRKVAPALRDAVGADGLNLLQSNGAAAWQTVDHLHVHLIPRFEGDGLRPPGVASPAEPDELSSLAAGISARF